MNETAQKTQATRTPKRNSFFGRVVRKLVVLSLILFAGLVVMSLTAARPAHLGVRSGQLAPVPDSPNCVSSMTEKESFKADPINVDGIENPMEKLKEIVGSEFSRARLISDDGNYLYFEFTSLIFRFVDDSEFLYDEQRKVIDFRSGSRVGHSDMGKNRKRMEKIRAAMTNL